jgi:hypothetical protein
LATQALIFHFYIISVLWHKSFLFYLLVFIRHEVKEQRQLVHYDIISLNQYCVISTHSFIIFLYSFNWCHCYCLHLLLCVTCTLLYLLRLHRIILVRVGLGNTEAVLQFHCIVYTLHFIELLTTKYKQWSTNLIYDTKSLEDHF